MPGSFAARALTATGAVAAAGLLTAAAAFAHGAPFTVTAGSAPAGTSLAFAANSIVSSSAPSPSHVTVRDTSTGLNILCSSAKFTGALRTGSSLGAPIASGASFIVADCSTPYGLNFDIVGSGTVLLNADDAADGVASGTITNLRAHVTNKGGSTCAFDVGANTGNFVSAGTSTVNPGALPWRYTNATQQLVLPPTKPGSLGLWNVRGGGANTYCISPSILKQGDLFSISVTFKVTADVAANDPIAVN